MTTISTVHPERIALEIDDVQVPAYFRMAGQHHYALSELEDYLDVLRFHPTLLKACQEVDDTLLGYAKGAPPHIANLLRRVANPTGGFHPQTLIIHMVSQLRDYMGVQEDCYRHGNVSAAWTTARLAEAVRSIFLPGRDLVYAYCEHLKSPKTWRTATDQQRIIDQFKQLPFGADLISAILEEIHRWPMATAEEDGLPTVEDFIQNISTASSMRLELRERHAPKQATEAKWNALRNKAARILGDFEGDDAATIRSAVAALRRGFRPHGVFKLTSEGIHAQFPGRDAHLYADMDELRQAIHGPTKLQSLPEWVLEMERHYALSVSYKDT